MRDHGRRSPKNQQDCERGAISLEFLGTIAWVLIMVLFAWQGLLGMHALTQANTAARDGARAVSLGDDGETAGRAALSESLRNAGSTVDCSPTDLPSVTCTADVHVPIIGSGLIGNVIPHITITRDATMPNIEAR